MIKLLVFCLALETTLNYIACTKPLNYKTTTPTTVDQVATKTDVTGSKNDVTGSKDVVTESKTDATTVKATLYRNTSTATKISLRNGTEEEVVRESVLTSTILPTLPFTVRTTDAVSENKTARLIEMINKINIKQIIPLVIHPGPKKLASSGLRSRKNNLWSSRKRGHVGLLEEAQGSVEEPRLKQKDEEENSLVFLLQPDLNVVDSELRESRFLISNPEVIENYMQRRSTREPEKTDSLPLPSSKYAPTEPSSLKKREIRSTRPDTQTIGVKIRNLKISNPSVVETYIRRRNSRRRKKKKERSTSSSSSSESDLRRAGDDNKPSKTPSAVKNVKISNPAVLKKYVRRRFRRRRKKNSESVLRRAGADTKPSGRPSEVTVRNLVISNPEVIAEYRRRHSKRRRKKKERSTSSSSSSSAEGFRRAGVRRKANGRITGSEYDEIDKRANARINYDERSDDYVISTKKGVWDYEHENWAVVSKKINWDDPRVSVENRSNERYKEHNNYNNEFVRKDEDIHREPKTEEDHKKYAQDKYKGYGGGDAGIRVNNELKEIGMNNGRNANRKPWSQEATTDHKRLRDDNDNREVMKRYVGRSIENTQRLSKKRESRDYGDNKNIDYGNPGEGRSVGKNNHWDRSDPKKEKMENNDEERYPRKPLRSDDTQDSNYNKKDDYRSDNDKKGASKGKTGRLVDDWIKQKDNKKTQMGNDDYKDDYEYSQKKSDRLKNSHRSKEERNDDRFKKDYISRERYNGGRDRDDWERDRNRNDGGANRESRPRFDSAERPRPVERDKDFKHSEEDRDKHEENDNNDPKLKIKKSSMRHEETKKEYGDEKDPRFESRYSREDLRSNKNGWNNVKLKDEDVSRNNENYQFEKQKHNPAGRPNAPKDEPRGRPKQKKRDEEKEDFWNRHAHNDWDKVGVDYYTKKSPKVPSVRVPIPAKPVGSKEAWDRHGNNEWDKVGNHERDYQERLSYDTKPQSHRSQDSGAPVYFGYVHTSLPFKGKKTVFDD